MSAAEAKAAARKAAFARRKAAHGQGLGDHLMRELASALGAYEGLPLAGYMPIRTEADPIPVMSAWSGPVGVPVIRGPGQGLDFHLWTPGAEMVEGPFGAAVPKDARPMTPRVLIVPMVAFDARGFRLGYGGGFYDRTLEALRDRGPIRAIGLAFAAQEAEALPTEPTDQPLDAVVTEDGLRVFS